MIMKMMIVLISTLFLISCGGDVASRYAEIKKGIQEHCNWLPTAASMTTLVNATVGIPVETVVRLVCSEVNKLAFNDARIIFVQNEGEDTICIEVDGKMVCIEGEKTDG